MIYLINLLMWLATFTLIGLAIYIHYFAVGIANRNVAGLVLGAFIFGSVSAHLTQRLIGDSDEDTK